MADNPRSIPELTNDNQPPASCPGQASHQDPSCPFCTITSTFHPISPSDTDHPAWDPDRLSPPTYVFLSTDHVVAFLDIAPLTRGHVLVAPRRHRVKVGESRADEAAEIGRVLPLITRSVLKAVLPDIPQSEVDYNIVQNNGPGAAQVIPHVHFHVIPRPPLDYKPPKKVPSPSSTSPKSPYAPSAIPTGLKASFVQFGRGQRNELDDDDAAILVKMIRENVKTEWEQEFGSVSNVGTTRESGLNQNSDIQFAAKL